MVFDAAGPVFHPQGIAYNESHTNEAGSNSNDGVQHNTDNLGALSKKFVDVVRASDQPLYNGSETHSQLSAAARYKPTRGQNPRRKKTAYAILRYLPITPRLQRLYASNTTAEHMSWHATHETESGVMYHPSDVEAWKYFNETHPDFALEPRNVRLGLCVDGFALMDNMANHIRVGQLSLHHTIFLRGCLQPLIEELVQLWQVGAQTRRSLGRNDDGLNNETVKHISIFNHPGRPYGASKMRNFLHGLYERHDVDTIDIDGIVEMQFLPWFKNYVTDPSNQITDPILKMLAWGPSQRVLTWPAYFVNGYNFHIVSHGEGKNFMNSGVCVRSTSYTDSDADFFGWLEEVIQFEYKFEHENMYIVLFKCRWVDPIKGVKIHPKYHLVDVNHKRLYQKYEPFILAQQAIQVYYAQYPSLRRDKVDWMNVCRTKARRTVESRWTDAAFQEDEVESVPIVTTEDEVQPLDDIDGEHIFVVADDEMNDDEEEEDSFEDYNTSDDEKTLEQDDDDDEDDDY
ncbi:UNVERIFIED_CONTAM: hypothetical protein Sradi_3633400 [Sesamum radiatum]|uniref:DUF4216 domain-containing protein n=1 Tax=Sesamum radiatum TaxID=300843 RepID=A0AAW2QJI6_SESRA